MALEKTEALLVTDRISFYLPRIVLGKLEVQWSRSLKYLGVQLDQRLSFGEHLRIATAKAIGCEANMARLMPNIDGPREAKRRLVASVVHSKLLYAAPVWASAIKSHAILKKLSSAQRGVALRVISAYRSVSTSAVLVLASVPPIDLLTREKQETFQLRRELSCNDNEQEYARAKVAVRKEARSRLVTRWQERWCEESTGRWSHCLIPDLSPWLEKNHGEVGLYLTQVLTGHGCFNAYLTRFKIRDDEACDYCGSPVDDAEHTLFACGEWIVAEEAASQAVGAELTPETMVPLMLKSEECWQHVESFITHVMRTKDLDRRSMEEKNG